jgi:enoyl-[acyl-carrier-protein] reductase (NADH)
MGLLEGKRILVTGVLTDASLAFAVARSAQQEGAEVVLSGAGRGLSLTKRTARKLPAEAEVLEIDVTEPGQLAAAAEVLASTGCCTPSATPRPSAWAATSSRPTGSRSKWRSTCRPTR